MRHPLHLLLRLVEQGSDGPRVLDMTIALELHADLDGLVAPQVAADVPTR